MNTQQVWYIIKTEQGFCQIMDFADSQTPEWETFWGPFASQDKAIAARIGLIRSGKCQPQ